MAYFTDDSGRDWQIDLHVTLARELRDRLEIDFLDGAIEDICRRLDDETELLVNTLYLCCREQCEDRGLSDEDFGRLLGGDALDRATDALLEAVVNFTRRPKRAIAEATLERIRRSYEEVSQQAVQVLKGPELDQTISRKIRESLADGPWSGSSPASSESTPDRSASGSSSGWPADGSGISGGTPPGS